MSNNDVQKDDEQQLPPPSATKPVLLYAASTLAGAALIASALALFQQKTQTNQWAALYDEHRQLTAWVKETTAVIDTQKQQQLELSSLKAQQDALTNALQKQTTPPKLSTHELLLNLNLQKALFTLELANLNALQNNDPTTTLALLNEADRQLKSIKNNQVLAIRQALAKDIQTLSTQPEVDLAGTLVKISAIASDAATLQLYHPAEQFKAESTPAPHPENKLKAHLNDALSMLKKLVIIQHHTSPLERPLVSKEQGEVKRSALLLQLYMAELAAMTHDQSRFNLCLDNAITIAQQIFNPNAPKTKALKKSLNQLQQINLQAPLPLSDKPITMLQALLHTEGANDD